MEPLDIINHFPGWAVFIVVGTIGGTIAYIFANRQFIKLQKSGFEEQIKMLSDTMKLQRETADTDKAVLMRTRDEAIKERDVYKDKLHEEKANHQATLLRMADLESRPDLSRILELEKKLHEEKMAIHKQMLESLSKLDEKLNRELAQNAAVCQKTAQMQEAVIKYLSENNILPAGYKSS